MSKQDVTFPAGKEAKIRHCTQEFSKSWILKSLEIPVLGFRSVECAQGKFLMIAPEFKWIFVCDVWKNPSLNGHNNRAKSKD